jgi:hypothetical protein
MAEAFFHPPPAGCAEIVSGSAAIISFISMFFIVYSPVL